jgi:hypothetical protein
VVEDQETTGSLLTTEEDTATSGELQLEESQARTDSGTADSTDTRLPLDVTTAKEPVYSTSITDKLLLQSQDT